MNDNHDNSPGKQPPSSAADLQQVLQQGLALHRQGNLAEAKTIYEAVLRIFPEQFDALNLLATLAAQTGDFRAAEELFGKAIKIRPDIAPTHNNHGVALKELLRLDEALASYDKALSLDPSYAAAHNNRGVALLDLKKPEEALATFDKALSLAPGDPEIWNNRGNALKDIRRPLDALACYDKAISLNPAYAEAYSNRGNVLLVLKRQKEALANYDKALSLDPGNPNTCNNRGVALRELGRPQEALASHDKALALKLDYAEAYNNRGIVLKELNRPEEALASYDKALALKPGDPETYNNRGNVLLGFRRLEEALACFDKALSLKPDYVDAHYNRGNALLELKRLEEALASFDEALLLKLDYAEAYINRGMALKELGRADEALVSFDRALALNPDNAGDYINRGNVLKELKRQEEALANYEKAMALDPNHEFLLGMVLHTKLKLCDWSSLPDLLRRYEEGISHNEKITGPFEALTLLDAPDLHKVAARLFVEAKFPRSHVLGPIGRRPPDTKIRIGYYSSDFRNHAVAYLTAEMFEAHDRNRFELYGFAFGPLNRDQMRKRISSAFDRFIDVRGRSDREVAKLSRELGIDIAVDLNGFTQYSRPGIFAEGCAPIQALYLGYPGTTGSDYFDYVIADKTVIPESRRSNFTEKVVYLPHNYQVNDSTRKVSDRNFTRQEAGLPEAGFVFCCFNNNYKILPATFDGWMRILNAVEGSVLWLRSDTPTLVRNLRHEAEARGVSGDRLVFATPLINLDEHLARHRLADLFIDTLPYNAHTTASDALWSGLPVLTRIGKAFAGRVAASLLNALGLPELITNTQEEFEAKAVELATNPDMLRDIRKKLAANRLTSPLFSGTLFSKHVEAAYEAMYARYQAGLPPDVIEIQAH